MALRFLICLITGLIFCAESIDGSKKQEFSNHGQSYPHRRQQLRVNTDIMSLASQILEPFLVRSQDAAISLQNLPHQPLHLSFNDDISANPTKHSNSPQIQRDLTLSRNQQVSPKLGSQNHSLQPPRAPSSSHKPHPVSQNRNFRLETVPLHDHYQNFSKDFPSSHWSYEYRNYSSGGKEYHHPDDSSTFSASRDARVRGTFNVHSSQDTTAFQKAQPRDYSRHSTRFLPLQSTFDAVNSDAKLISVSRRPSPGNRNINKNVERGPRISHIRVQNERNPSMSYHTANTHIRTNLAVHPDSSHASDAKFGPVPLRDTQEPKSVQHYDVYPDDKDQSGRRFLLFRAPALITTARPSSAPFTVDTREKKLQRKPAFPSFEASHEDIHGSKEKRRPTPPTIIVQRPNTPSVVIDVVTLHNIHTDNAKKAIENLGIQSHSNAKYERTAFENNPAEPHPNAKHSNYNYPFKQFEEASYHYHDTTVKQITPPSSFTPEYSPEVAPNVLPEPTTPLPPLTAAFDHDEQQSHHQLESNSYEHISPFSNTLTSTKRPKVKAKPKPVSVRTSTKPKTKSIAFLPQGGSFGSQNVPGQPGSDYPIFNEVPFTNFDCKEFQRPGFYADIEAGCQVFHNCDMGMKKHSFICPNGTIFHQQLFICDWWYNVRCDDSPDFFNLNEGLYLETAASKEKQQKGENHKRNNKRVSS